MGLRVYICNKFLENTDGADSGTMLEVTEAPSTTLVSYLSGQSGFTSHSLFTCSLCFLKLESSFLRVLLSFGYESQALSYSGKTAFTQCFN